MPFEAQATVDLTDPRGTIERICVDLEEHDAIVSREEARHVIRFPNNWAILEAAIGKLTLRAFADDISELHYMKMVLAAHVVEHGDIPASVITWQGDGSEPIPPYFRFMKVVSIENVTPHMRRVRLSGEDLERYFAEDNLHVVLVIPPPGEGEPGWPRIGASGLVEWPESARKPVTRHYTIRSYDRLRRTVDIDFVLHDDGGPGSSWAYEANPGQIVGMAGPVGLGVREADWYLLAGDETALPAITRIIENLPPSAQGVALIEVADAEDEQVITSKAEIELRWLHRNGAAPGTTTLLADAIRKVDIPTMEITVFAWAGCEFDSFKAIRSYLRKERGLKKDQHLVVSYWRKGKSEDEAAHGGDDS